MTSQDDSSSPSWIAKLFSPLPPGPDLEASEALAYDPFEQDPAEALPWADPAGAGADRRATDFMDVTSETLDATRQEASRSLERDRDDPFFWREARPDAVAGMSKVFLRERCASRYWQAAVAANSYALWGAVLMARERARSRSEPCGRDDLEALAWIGMRSQASALRSLDSRPRARAELSRAEGLPVPGCWMGEAHKQAGLRALFAAALCERPVQWPDLPARLGADDEVPDRLPALRIDLETLVADPLDPDRREAQLFWSRSFESETPELLWIPDWASWLLGAKGPDGLLKVAPNGPWTG